MASFREEARSLLAAAVAEGDPKALAQRTAQDVLRTARGPGGPSISDEQLDRLRMAVSSGDAAAMELAGTALSNAFRDLVIEEVAQGRPLEYRAAREAWRLLGCELGSECGPGNLTILSGCAHEGRCDATTLPDRVHFYDVSPAEAQLIDRYRRVFRSIAERGDWSGLRFSRGPNPRGGQALFATP